MSGRAGGTYQPRKRKASKELSEDEGDKPSVAKRKLAGRKLFKGDEERTKTSKGKPKASKLFKDDKGKTKTSKGKSKASKELSEGEESSEDDEGTSSSGEEGDGLEPLIEIIANDRLGKKVRMKCSPTDTVGDLKLLIAAQTGTNARKIILKKANIIYKDHIRLDDYEIHDGMSMELYYG